MIDMLFMPTGPKARCMKAGARIAKGNSKLTDDDAKIHAVTCNLLARRLSRPIVSDPATSKLHASYIQYKKTSVSRTSPDIMSCFAYFVAQFA